MNWIDSLAAWLKFVATGGTGQAGEVIQYPPDKHIPVTLTAIPPPNQFADRGIIKLEACGGKSQDFTPDKAREAVLAFAAAVEGYS